MKLELSEVRREFEGEAALRDVSLCVDEGEVVAVIGPSGAGKTTLLRLASCFASPDEGRVYLDGTDPWALARPDRRELRRRIGVVFQRASLFETSVERNVDSGLRIRRTWPRRLVDAGRRLAAGGRLRRRLLAALSRIVPGDGDRRWPRVGPPATEADRIDDALSLVGLEDSREREARSLSGGEAQRVAFARAVAYDPDLLVLDEPTSDLDPRNTAILEHAIDRARDRGHGILLATHDMHQARRVADRIGVLVDGELIECGPPTQIFESPTDPRTRRFVDGDLLYEVSGDDAADALDGIEHP